jgi:hypothetical protein
MKSGFMVFWMLGEYPGNRLFQQNELSECLKYMESLRNCAGYEFVGMVSQNPDSVGKPGVSDKLPEDYSWSKQHRGDQIESEFKTIIGGRSRG